MIRLKARLFAKGFSQFLGIEFAEVFFSVSNCVTIRLLLPLAVEHE